MTPELAAAEARSRATTRRKRNPMIFWLQALIVALIVAAVGAGLYQLTIEQTGSDQALAVPGLIGGYRLTDVVRGEEAITQLRQLHGKDIGMTAGWIGFYQQNATVWVAAAGSEAQATQLLDSMNRRIGAGNGPFTNLQQQNVNGQTIYTVVGQGQRHYYYQQGKLVIWLAAPKGGEERFLAGALEAIR
ncbi:MAG: hypothetical protein EPO21_14900 [Chloroflexota bacterium]|nr:MAG: hypothetical protein EPO21_14900 [Chloroflexota bacterium]